MNGDLEDQYRATHERLATDPQYRLLLLRAKLEEQKTPTSWFHRNRLAIYVELAMPIDQPSPAQPLYPRPGRARRSTAHSRWRVRYEDMVYEGGVSASWTSYHHTKTGARLAAFWHQHIASYGGTVTLTDQRNALR